MLNFGDNEVVFAVAEGLQPGRYVDILGRKTLDVDSATRFSVTGLDAAVLVRQDK